MLPRDFDEVLERDCAERDRLDFDEAPLPVRDFDADFRAVALLPVVFAEARDLELALDFRARDFAPDDRVRDDALRVRVLDEAPLRLRDEPPLRVRAEAFVPRFLGVLFLLVAMSKPPLIEVLAQKQRLLARYFSDDTGNRLGCA